MPKHRRQSTRPPRSAPLRWRPSDVIQLIACLDYCLESGRDFKKLSPRILRDVTGKDFSEKQISGRLKLEWDNFGRLGSETVQDLLDEGSKFLTCYLATDFKEIEEAAAQIRIREAKVWRRTDLLRTPSRSSSASDVYRLRSTPPASNRRDVSPSCVLLAQGSPEPRKRALLQNDVSANSGRSINIGEQNRQKGGKSRRLMSGNGSQRESTGESQQPIISIEEDMVYEPSGPRSEKAEYIASQTVFPSPTSNEKEDDGTDDVERVKVLQGELQSALGKIRQHQAHIFTLENRLSHANTELREMRHCNRAAADSSDDVAMQASVRYENSALKLQLAEARTTYRPHTKAHSTADDTVALPVNPPGSSFHQKDVREQWELLADDIRDACASVDLDSPLSAAEMVANELTHNTAAVGAKTNDARAVAESWLAELLPEGCDGIGSLVALVSKAGGSELDIARFMAAAGLWHLVFRSNFPDFMSRESPLLDQYRRHVLAQDGSHVLSQLDLLAHKSLMAEDYFQEILRDHARVIAEKLCSTLSLFTTPSKEINHLGGIEAGANDSRADHLTSFFFQGCLRALNIKAQTLLSPVRYQVLFFRPGDQFSPSTMRLDNDNDGNDKAICLASPTGSSTNGSTMGGGCRGRGGGVGGGTPRGTVSVRQHPSWQLPHGTNELASHPSKLVKICLFPAIYMTSREDKQDRLAEGMMDLEIDTYVAEYSTFVGCLNSDGQEKTLISKALVLV